MTACEHPKPRSSPPWGDENSRAGPSCGTPVECYAQAIKLLNSAEQKIAPLMIDVAKINSTVEQKLAPLIAAVAEINNTVQDIPTTIKASITANGPGLKDHKLVPSGEYKTDGGVAICPVGYILLGCGNNAGKSNDSLKGVLPSMSIGKSQGCICATVAGDGYCYALCGKF